jgi:GPH family glycoside/pentoside/hexuronide:cation symporter
VTEAANPASRSRFWRVPLSSALLYGSATIPMNMMGTCLALYLYFFYTDSLGLPPLYLSAVMIIGSLWDAVSDQLMGQISDRTTWRSGRRRPYLLLGALPLGLSFYLVLAPPASLGDFELFFYLLICRIVLFTASTVIYVPLYALAPEMAQDYHDRTRLTAVREGLGNLGDLIGMLAPPALLLLIAGNDGPDLASTRAAYAAVGVVGLVAALIFITASFFGSYEDPSFEANGELELGVGLRALRDSPAFRALIFATVLPAIAVQMAAGLFLYIITHVLGVTDQIFVSTAFICYVAAALCSYPMWASLARRRGKAWAFRGAICMMATSYLSIYALGEGTMWRMYPTMALAGAGSAGFWTAVFSQLADITDMDELEVGSRREGLFAGFASLCRKLGYAVGGGAIGIGLWLVGYDENASSQSADTIFGLKLVFSIPTFCFAMLGLWFFRRYPVTEHTHRDVLEALERRRAASTEG